MIAQWKPIDTAPQDDREIVVGRIVGVKLDWWHKAQRIVGTHGCSYKMKGGFCIPTHWHPLAPGSDVEVTP
jgi:hypothetical protein